MKKIVLSSYLALAFFILMIGCNNKGGDVKLTNNRDTVSYVIGVLNGKNITRDTILNPEMYLKGFENAIRKQDTALFSEEAIQKILGKFQQEMRMKQQQEMMKQQQAMAVPNRQKGAQFLAENKTKEGVVELPSGLQYKVIKEGKGAKPVATDQVTVNYEGTLIDGTIFDSSYKRGEPATFMLNGVIPGWTEALQLMKVGAEYELYIPADLAYGDTQSGQIPPGSTLIFKVELLSIGEPKK